jgi:DNA-directed RNA polymerase subunit H (RpoH/RPB5)
MSGNEQDSRSVLLKFNARNTILQLLKTQGYDVAEYENFSINEMSSLIENNQLDMLLNKNSKKDSKAYVCFMEKINLQIINNSISDLYDDEEVLNKNDILVMISNNELPETLNKCLNDCYEKGHFIVAFSLATLQYNILKHKCVPSHVILTKPELEEVKQRYNISDNVQFPTISRFDAVAKAIGMRPDEVCKIERSSSTSIVSDYYRLCTK